jgi:hypothetical protein
MPTVNSKDDRIGVELSIGTSEAKKLFHLLLAQREMLEAQLGFPLDWQELPTRISSRAATWKTGSPPGEEARWPEYVEWLADRIVKMHTVLRPVIKQLP